MNKIKLDKTIKNYFFYGIFVKKLAKLINK